MWGLWVLKTLCHFITLLEARPTKCDLFTQVLLKDLKLLFRGFKAGSPTSWENIVWNQEGAAEGHQSSALEIGNIRDSLVGWASHRRSRVATPLVVQWLRIRLPGDKGSILGPGRFHMLWSNEARVPQLLKPASPKACVLCNERSHCDEKPAYCRE